MSEVTEYWYFHIPNYAVALIMYLLIGRLLLSFFVDNNWDNYIWRNFCWMTNPMVRAVSFITPNVVPYRVLLIFSILWMAVLRLLLFWILRASD